MLNADAALLRLKQGNEIFRSNTSYMDVDKASRSIFVKKQTPFAIILGCSDSRVPSELVFGQGLGELFVVRVAGNTAMTSQIGSIEFAVDSFSIKLIVVLGHSYCGAIKATIESLEDARKISSPNLQAIIDSIKPGVEFTFDPEDSHDTKVQKAVRANVRSMTQKLLSDSIILQQKVAEDGLKIVGAEYCIESGMVRFF